MTFFLKKWFGKSKNLKKEQKAKKKYLKRAKAGKTMKKVSPYSKEQDKLLKWLSKEVTGKMGKELDLKRDPLYQAGASKLGQLLSGDPGARSAFEAPMRREFSEQIMPQIAEQYAGAGAGRSSAFRSAAAGAGGALAENLGAMREQLAMSAIPHALQYAQAPLQNRAGFMDRAIGKQPSTIYEEKYQTDYEPQGGWGEKAGAGLGAAAGAYYGGPAGAAMGYQTGSSVGASITGDPGYQTQKQQGKGFSSLQDMFETYGKKEPPVQRTIDAPTSFDQTFGMV